MISLPSTIRWCHIGIVHYSRAGGLLLSKPQRIGRGEGGGGAKIIVSVKVLDPKLNPEIMKDEVYLLRGVGGGD